MKTDIVVTVVAPDSLGMANKLEGIEAIAAAAIPPTVKPPDIPDIPDRPDPPVLQPPYFDIGDGSGKAGDVVELSVEAGCRFLTSGFHIGGGVGKQDKGYGLFKAVGWKLGAYLTAYLKSVGGIEKVEDSSGEKWVDSYWSLFQMVAHGVPGQASPYPEEWWELAMAFFSMSKKETWEPTMIPSGTELFTLSVRILEDTAPGEYEVTCKDEHYYTSFRRRTRDFLFTAGRDSPFASGGITKLELFGGKITVTG